jgi:F-type H+-transporting ATPase subunit epsilon
LNLQLITLTGVKYSADAYAVELPTASGIITVLPQHEPLMSVLVPGVITVRRQANDPDYHLEHYATYGGVVEVLRDTVQVLVDEADLGDEINEAEAEKARAAAEALLGKASSQVELEHAQAMVDRQAVRLQVAQLKRRHTRQR